RDRYLFLQGKHVLHVSAREVGQPDTEDSTPLEIAFRIDTLAPYVTVTRTEDGAAVQVKAWDIVSDEADLRGRWRANGGAWSDWMPLDAMKTISAPDAISAEVEVVDEEGNVGRISQDLIRGRGDPTLSAAGSGCGCAVPGAAPSSAGTTALATLAVLGALVFLALRRRQERKAALILGLGSVCVGAATSQGCACGSSDAGSNGTGCGSDCNQPCQPAIPKGMLGAYLSVAKAKDGAVWVAGYNDAVLSNGDNYLYGDLVVGKYDQGKQLVDWHTADGLPPARTDNTCPDNDPSGWRKGESDSGDDVGLWTSIALDASDAPMVAYYDLTHGTLKFATSGDGGQTWNAHVVSQATNADIGRYAKLI